MEAFSEIDDLNQKGILRLLCEVEENFFSSLEINSDVSARIVVNIIRICVTNVEDEDLAKRALSNLSLFPYFAVLIASARMYFYNEIVELRPYFRKIVPVQFDFEASLTFPIELIDDAIMLDDFGDPDLFPRHEIISFFVTNTNISLHGFISQKVFYKLYLCLVSDFISSQSLQRAFVITNSFVQIIRCNDRNFLNDTTAVLFSSEDVRNLFQKIKENDCITDEPYSFIGTPEDLNEVEQLLIEIPYTGIDQTNIIQSIYAHPALSSSFIRLIKERMNPDNELQSEHYAKQMLSVYIDLTWFLIEQGTFFTFITHTLEISMGIRDADCFYSVWILPLTLLRYAYGNSSQTIRDQIISYIENYKMEYIYFLKSLLQIDCDDEEIPQTDYTDGTLAMEPAMTLYQLLRNEINVDDILQNINERIYLWVPILIWAFKSEESKKVNSVKHPNSPLINFLFHSVMLKSTNPVRGWRYAMGETDYQIITLFRPENVSAIKQTIFEQFNVLSRPSPIDAGQLAKILTTWRAWATIFSFNELLKVILSQLVWKTVHRLVPREENNLFQSVAYILSIMINEEKDLINVAIDMILDTARNNIVTLISGVGIAGLCLILILTFDGPWEEVYKRVLQFCIESLETDELLQQTKTIFSLTFIRKSFIIPRLRSIVTSDEVFDALQKVDDWKAMIDFCISRHQFISDQNNVFK
ncbi:hypothetical protein GPJ56_002460 [Histomonas meleagridis]|uniref:uncharacterized protein n=1 Tax=Histomonas meleagridis TaxID=135588 RepID=UPI003559EC8D|nr:hypothetical protein GPJ56_002460 [Histomonas meleagridis]KAH0798255.1 hypothetical protein GO595_008943 [Histomonas meleagridis]